jgi:hypothetical protein
MKRLNPAGQFNSLPILKKESFQIIALLPNKQLFSSLKIRRCMISWMKCWARKSPAYVKNPGNIRSKVRLFWAAENPRIIRMGGALVA